MKYAGLFSFLLLIVGIVPVFALYEPPTTQEKNLFDQLLVEFERVNATKKDVSDIIQTFQKPLIISFLCNPHDVNNQIITVIKTKLAKFDESIVHQDLITGGSYTWHCSETIQDGKVTLDCNNELRINPKIMSDDTQIEPKLHDVENMAIIYHELLHGQLMVDAMKSSPIWQNEICTQQTGKIDYSFADPNHEIINYLQTQFTSELIEKDGGKVITKEIPSDETINGTFTIKVLSLLDYPLFQNGTKITLRTNNISENSFSQVKNDIFLSGHLKNNTKSGMAWFYLFKSKTPDIPSESVPVWVKRIAGLWSSTNTDDKDFFTVVNYLVEHNLVKSNSEKNTISTMPHWIKKSAHFWFTGEINDDTFVNSIQYLISRGIIS